MAFSALIVFLLTVTIGTRKLLFHFTPGFHEYEAIFLYVSDIILVIFLLSVPFVKKNDEQGKSPKVKGKWMNSVICLSLAAFLLAAGSSILFAPLKLLALYQFARLCVLVLMALAVAKIARDKQKLRIIFGIIAFLAVLQAGIGIAQFVHQESIGLKWLGESPISPTNGNSSTVVISGARVLRAYGLFPHPNILGAFLVLGLLALMFFYLSADKELYGKLFDWKKSIRENFRRFIRSKFLYIRFALAVGIFIVLLGLVTTFSRSAWIVADSATLLFIIFALISRSTTFHAAGRLLFLLVVSGLILAATLGQFIFPRALISSTESAVTVRLSYNELGLNLIKKHPFGVGIGNQVYFSQQNNVYQQLGMDKVWQWQPIHNLYLLMASEIGVVGLLLFVGFIIWTLSHRTLIGNWKLEIGNSRVMLVALLTLGLFDHYLWTIWQGQLMLWLVIGMVMGVGARSSTDRIHPSEG